MKLWATSRCRQLHGLEGLRHQGIFLSETSAGNFSSDLLADLAGNSFHTGCCLAALTCQLCVLAVAYTKHQTSLSVSARHFEPMSEDEGDIADLLGL